MRHVVVVGAGLAGLSAACHLVGSGYRVTVLEAADRPGGRAGAIEQDGFTFDSGPVVLTMRGLLADAIRAAGSNLDDLLTLHRLDPAYRARFADGSVLHVRHGHEAMRDEIATHCGAADAKAFDAFVAWLKALYAAELSHFIDANFNSPLDLLRHPGSAARLLQLGGFGRLGPSIEKRFRDERLHRMFSFQAMYAGLPPAQALALYAVITYMDSIEGVWFPEGGMRAIGPAMAQAVTLAGGEVRCSTPVERVLRRPDGAVTGVRLADGSAISADAVVVTVDLPVAYDSLLDLDPPRLLRRRPRYSPSCVVWHAGVQGEPEPDAVHHTIHFGQQWQGAFDDLMVRGTLMQDPSRFVCRPSLDDPAAAPAGTQTMYVLEPTPNLADGELDWTHSARVAMRERLAGFVAGAGYPSEVLSELLVTPQDWLDQGMAAGTPFALAHTFTQTGPFRPSNVRKEAPGLVFAGSGTTPGVGIPMVLISGKLAAERVGEVLR
ncbi:MAG: phytoene desaturase [Micropruina sp.]|nr:phytoene desaturase [Micropruina sp.]